MCLSGTAHPRGYCGCASRVLHTLKGTVHTLYRVNFVLYPRKSNHLMSLCSIKVDLTTRNVFDFVFDYEYRGERTVANEFFSYRCCICFELIITPLTKKSK